MLVTTDFPLYRGDVLCTIDGYKVKIVPMANGNQIDADVVLLTNTRDKYSYGLTKVNESDEYEYRAFRIVSVLH